MKKIKVIRAIIGIVIIAILSALIVVLAVSYKTADYKVVFDSKGGSAVETQTVKDGAKATKPSDPTKQGYTFEYWCADTENNSEFDFDTKITKDITLYAKWKEKTPVVSATETKYTVSFDLAGCTNISKFPNQVVVKGSKAARPAETPLKDAFKFDGWDFDFETPIESDTVIKAKWLGIFKVTFNLDGGINDSAFNPQFIIQGSAAVKPQINPQKKGWHFGGWDFDFETKIISDTVITAKWFNRQTAVKIILNNLCGAEIRDNYIVSGYGVIAGNEILIPKEYVLNNDIVLPDISNFFKDSNVLEGLYSVCVNGSYSNKLKTLTAGQYETVNLYAKWQLCFLVQASFNVYDGYTYGIQINPDYKDYIKSITIPDKTNGSGEINPDSGKIGKVIWVMDYGFSEMQYLEKVVLTKNIKVIGEYAFSDCISLKNINLSKVEYIGEYAFCGCISLKSVNLSCVDMLSAGVLYGCSSLQKIEMNKTGYKFIGWSTTTHNVGENVDFKPLDFDYIKNIVNENQNLFAIWEQ